jgi:Cd2+/Zn2+-exporting ATPase
MIQMKRYYNIINFDNILLIILLLVLGLSIFKLQIGDYFLLVVSIVATIPVVISAIKAISTKKISVDLLASVALIFSILAGEWVSAIFINLMLTSARVFLAYNEARARKNIESLLKLKPKDVKVKRNGVILEIKPEEVKIGEIVVVDLGERAPVDGTVCEGEATIDESSLTGESLPVNKKVGDKVLSSTLVTSGRLEIKTEKIGSETTLEKIIRLVETAQIDKPDIHTKADIFAKWYLIIVFLGAIGLYLYFHNVLMVLAVLLVVCADDVAVAVPLAFLTAISYCARKGIIVKGASYLEAMRDVKIIFVDKTGTLTRGKLHVEHFICPVSSEREKLLKYSGVMASLSDHPISKAVEGFVKNAQGKVIAEDPKSFKEIGGKGAEAVFGKTKIVLGKLSYIEESGAKIDTKIKEDILREENDGFNVTVISYNGEYYGYFVLADELKSEINLAVKDLKKLGVEKIIMLTGDNERVAKRISDTLGLTGFYANLMPSDKIEHIRKSLNKDYKVMMVGDGINDAASLSLADIGVAMGGAGLDVAIDSANIILMKDDFSKIAELMRISKYVMKIADQDFKIWGFTNIVGLALVFLLKLSPTNASAYNFLTDFLPLINSTRIFRLYVKGRI